MNSLSLNDNIIKRSEKYFTFVMLLYALFFLALVTLNFLIPPSSEIVIFQLVSCFSSIFFFIVGLRFDKNSLFVWITLFHILILFHIYLLDIADQPEDYFFYKSHAENTLNLSTGQVWNYYNNLNLDISDRGYSFFLYYLYRLFGREWGDLFVIVVKLILNIWVCFFIWRLSLLAFGKNAAKIVLLLWGINIYSVYFESSGLKESVFVFFTTAASYYLYLLTDKIKFQWLLLFVIFVGFTVFFRVYVTIFFILSFIGYFVFRRLYVTYFALFCIFLYTIIFIGTTLIVMIVPEVKGFLIEREDVYSGLVGNTLNVINAFIGPYPAFRYSDQLVNLQTSFFAVFKLSFSLFAILGIVYSIHNKLYRLYPVINVVIYNMLLTIISGFSLNYRYMHITMPLFFMFIPYGISCCYRKWLICIYLIAGFILTFLYNTR